MLLFFNIFSLSLSLQDLSNINEPELIICIGMSDTLAGFSPWHTRLSEIM
jgi:hypothetical protein